MARFAVVPKGWTTPRTARDHGGEGGGKRPGQRADNKPVGTGRIKDSCKSLLPGNVLLTAVEHGGGKGGEFAGDVDLGSPLKKKVF